MKAGRRRDAAIDWAEARERLAGAEESLDALLHPPPGRERELLDERARALARPAAHPASAAGRLELVVFRLGPERYALETRYAREVARLAGLTPVPGAPPVLSGVTNLRGDVLPVFDLTSALRPGNEPAGERVWVVVVGRETPELGVLADEVDRVESLLEEELRPPLETRTDAGRRWIRGVTADGLVVLEGDALLADPELAAERAD